MCTIGGFFTRGTLSDNDYKKFMEFFTDLMQISIERGNDSIGFVGYQENNNLFIRYTCETPENMTNYNNTLFLNDVFENYRFEKGIFNTLGLPTTEDFGDIRRNIQPFSTKDENISEDLALKYDNGEIIKKEFSHDSKFLVHNGLLSNDNEYLKKLSEIDKDFVNNSNIITRYKNGDKLVDSYALLEYFNRKENIKDESEYISNIENEIKGGYALIYLDKDNFVALRNYVDLNKIILKFEQGEVHVYCTKSDYLQYTYNVFNKKFPNNNSQYINLENIRDKKNSIRYNLYSDELTGFSNSQIALPLPPYSFICYTGNEKNDIFNENSFKDHHQFGKLKNDKITESKKRAVVIISGGLDSTTAATIASDNPDIEEITLLNFRYKCHAQEKEEQAVKDVCEALQKRHPEKKILLKYFDTDLFEKIGGTTLIGDNENEISKGYEGVETRNQWVPARNLVFISLIVAYVEANNIGKIYLGLNLEESGLFPDNSTIFYEDLNRVLNHASPICPEIINPLGNYMKHMIVNEAYKIKAPIDKAWSCYHGKYKYQCGNCGPCVMRRKSHEINEIKDNIKYMDEEILSMIENGKFSYENLKEIGINDSSDIEAIFKDNYLYSNLYNEILEKYNNL